MGASFNSQTAQILPDTPAQSLGSYKVNDHFEQGDTVEQRYCQTATRPQFKNLAVELTFFLRERGFSHTSNNMQVRLPGVIERRCSSCLSPGVPGMDSWPVQGVPCLSHINWRQTPAVPCRVMGLHARQKQWVTESERANTEIYLFPKRLR